MTTTTPRVRTAAALKCQLELAGPTTEFMKRLLRTLDALSDAELHTFLTAVGTALQAQQALRAREPLAA